MKTLHFFALTLSLLASACAGEGTDDPPPEPAALGAADGGTCPLPGPTPFGSATFIAPCPGTDHLATCGVHVVATGEVTDQWWGCGLGTWTCVEACR